eukprot:3594857-Rhodomonas_salina.1
MTQAAAVPSASRCLSPPNPLVSLPLQWGAKLRYGAARGKLPPRQEAAQVCLHSCCSAAIYGHNADV